MLALGTANWAGTYGAPGREATVDEATARSLAEAFLSAGHDLVDTAPAYGDAEEMVGAVLNGTARVVSKVPAQVMQAGQSAPTMAVEGLRQSLKRVRVERFAGVLLHDPTAGTGDPELARAVVDAVRASGIAPRVGVSVYEPAEAYAAVERLGADLVQVPCNLLDQRFVQSGCISDLVTAGVEVHVRSVFLNGVLLAEPGELGGPLAALAPAVRRLHAEAAALGCTPLALALRFARSGTEGDAVVVGAFALSQLKEALRGWEDAAEFSGENWERLAAVDVAAVDPRTWSS
jgi:aryl-alcohol dehydrogenase-like predicted oxidoreductase